MFVSSPGTQLRDAAASPPPTASPASATPRSTAASWPSPPTCATTSLPLLIGQDPARIEDIWQYLYKGAYWRRGPVTMTAIAAVDIALWDIKGKVAGLPVYQLLGGRARDGVLVYSHASGSDIPALLDDVERFLDLGYKAIRAQAAVPGVGGTYGVRKGKAVRAGGLRPARRAAAGTPRPTWTSRPATWRRYASGSASTSICCTTSTTGSRPSRRPGFGKRVEDCRLFWMEDPTPAENQEAFRLIRQHTTTPVAVGEVFNSIWDVQHLITEQLIDYVRTSVVHAGGITHLRRIFDLAALYQVRTGSHGATDLSPVTLAAAVHLDLAVPNFGIQEYMGHAEETAEVFRSGVHLRRRHAASGRGARPRCGVRREGRRPLPVRAAVPARGTAPRRIGARLVSAAGHTPLNGAGEPGGPRRPGRLGRAALSGLPPECRPALDPEALRTRVVHFGLGAFHRAHQAV